MKLRPVKLIIKNFCQFKELEIDFPVGTIGLTGPNGSGKTNLVRALYMALTGENPTGNRKDLLAWDATFGYVTAHMESEAGPFTIHRDIAKGSHKLTAPFLSEELTKKEQVNAWLSKAIGTEVSRLDGVAFVPQGRLAELLTMTHSARISLLYSLFKLDWPAAISQAILNRRTALPALRNRADEIRTISDDLKNLTKREAELESELKAMREALGRNEAAYQAANLDFSKPLDTEMNTKLSALMHELGVSTKRLEEISLITNRPPTFTVQSLERALLAGSRRQKALSDLAITTAELDELKQKKETLKPVEVKDYSKTIADLSMNINMNMKLLAVLQKGECPTCGAKYQVTPEQLAEKNAELDQAQTQLVEVKKADQIQTEAVKAYSRETLTLEMRINTTQNKIVELNDIIKELEGQEAIDPVTYDSRMKELEQYAACKKEYDTIAARFQVLETELKQLENMPAVSQEVKDRAQAVIKAYTELKDKFTALEKIAVEIKTKQSLFTESLKRMQQEQAEFENIGETLTILDKARHILHADMLPKLAATEIVAGFNQKLEAYEAVFNYGFSCRLNADMDFVVDFPKKTGLPVDVLSGGQRMAAAAAAIMALHAMLAPNLGILVLDEPTYGLDANALQSLAQVISVAGGHLKGMGMTVLVPTHENALFPIFDDIIRIGEL